MRGVRALVAAGLAAALVASFAACGVGADDPPSGMQEAAADKPQPADAEPVPEVDAAASPTITAGGDGPSATERPATLPDGEAPPLPAITDAPRAGRSVDALAAQIEQAETVVRDPASSEARVARQAQRQQVAYRELALHPSWLDPVLDALPADLLRWYRGAGEAHGVEWEVLAAINLVETGLGRIDADSVAGAQGPMQFMPATWARWGNGDVHDPHHAIYGAARYLAASGAADGRLTDALFAYNNDNRYVRAVNLYAGLLRRTPLLFRGLYHWQVYYRSAAGDLLLPEGYPTVPAAPRP